MMKDDAYKKILKETIESVLPGTIIQYVNVPKNNICEEYLSIGKVDNPIAVRMAVSDLGPDPRKAALQALNKAVEMMKKKVTAPNSLIKILSSKECLSYVYPKLISIDNKEYLKDKFYDKYLDMAVIYIIVDPTVREVRKMTTITTGLMASLDISAEEVRNSAIKNFNDAGYKICPISKVLENTISDADIDDEELEEAMDFDMPIMVVSNNTAAGASVLLNAGIFDEVANKLGVSELYILPSSIYEVIAVPTFLGEPDELINLVQLVNDTTVDPIEQLTNSVYYYSTDTGKIIIA